MFGPKINDPYNTMGSAPAKRAVRKDKVNAMVTAYTNTRAILAEVKHPLGTRSRSDLNDAIHHQEQMAASCTADELGEAAKILNGFGRLGVQGTGRISRR